MSPPSYSDIGKEAGDILNKGYHFCWWKFICNTKANDVEIITNGYCQERTGDTFAAFETKYYYDLLDLQFIGRYSNTNVLGLAVDSPLGWLIKNLKLDCCFELGPTYDGKVQKIKVAYGTENLQLNSNLIIDDKGIYTLNSAVLQYGKFLFGYKLDYDIKKHQFDYHNFALGWITEDLSITLNVSDKDQEFSGTVHKRLNEDMEIGIFGSKSVLTGAWKLGIGSKYFVGDDDIFQCMLLTPVLLGLSYQRRFNENIALGVSTLIDGYYFKLKMGVSIEINLDL